MCKSMKIRKSNVFHFIIFILGLFKGEESLRGLVKRLNH